jgi:hypothetical protein
VRLPDPAAGDSPHDPPSGSSELSEGFTSTNEGAPGAQPQPLRAVAASSAVASPVAAPWVAVGGRGWPWEGDAAAHQELLSHALAFQRALQIAPNSSAGQTGSTSMAHASVPRSPGADSAAAAAAVGAAADRPSGSGPGALASSGVTAGAAASTSSQPERPLYPSEEEPPHGSGGVSGEASSGEAGREGGRQSGLGRGGGGGPLLLLGRDVFVDVDDPSTFLGSGARPGGGRPGLCTERAAMLRMLG